jgi:trimeric autotransporter adhesin
MFRRAKSQPWRGLYSFLAGSLLASLLSVVVPLVISQGASAAQDSECTIGSSALCPATSPQEIYNLYGTTTDGRYFIKVNGVATEVFLLMNRTGSDNGAWVLLMKGAKGTTNFAYNSAQFTSNTSTLATTSLSNDVTTDAKFSAYNSLSLVKMLAVFKDPTAGTIPASGDIASNAFGGHVWLESFSAATAYTKLTTTTNLNSPANDQFTSVPFKKWKTFDGATQVMSYQAGNGRYGFNGAPCNSGNFAYRWGIGWNQESDWASCDVVVGIGLGAYSPGDIVAWDGVTTGSVSSNRGHGNTGFQIWGKVAEPSLGAPTSLTATAAGSGQVNLSWGDPASTTPVDYVVQYKTAAAATYSNSFLVSGQKTASITGLTNGTSYNFRVFARTATDSTSSANIATSTVTRSVSTTLSTPSAPTVSATANTLKSISVSWSAIANVSSYTLKLYNASSTLLATSGLTGLTGTSATITASNLASLGDNTAYKVSITAIGNGSSYLDSSESTKSDVTTNAAPGSPTITVQPTAQTSTFNATATFSVTATSPDSGSLGYQWQVNTGSSWANLAAGTGFTTSSYTTATLAMAASGYQYRVNVTNTKNGATSAAVTSSALTLTVNKADQAALSFTINVSSKTSPYSQAITLTPSGGSGDGATTYAIVSGGSATSCALANNTASNTITATTSGTCLIQATKATDTNYLVTTSSNVTFTFNKADQTTLSAPILSATTKSFPYSQSPLSVSSATGGSGTGGLSITSVANGTATGCAWNGTTLSASTSGTCTLTITRAGDDNFNAATATATFTFNKASQSALSITSTSVNHNSTLTLATSGGSGDGEVSYVVNSGNCSISSGVLTSTSAGSCSVTATKAATTDYESISSSATIITVNQIAQTALSFTINISGKTSPYSQAVTFTPSGGTGTGAKSYAIVSGGTSTGCALANNTASNTITASSAGTCLIQLTQAADTNYLVATSSSVTFTFNKATQSALSISSTSGTYGSSITLTTSGGTSGGVVSYVVDSGSCSVSGATLSNTSAGDCYVTATMAENVNYDPISSDSTKITIAKAEQISLSITSTSVNFNATLTLTTSGGLGTGGISYVVNSGNCSISSGVLSSTSAGSCSITATKAADTNYEEISSTATTITVNQVAQATLTATIDISSKVFPYSQAITLGSSGGSGTGSITFAIYSGGTATSCTLSGSGTSNTITATTSGTCLIRATRAGDTNYTSISSASITFTFIRATQSALTITSSTANYGTPLTLATSGGTGTGAITYSVTSGPCTVSNNTTLNYSAAGTCVLTATKAQDNDYSALTSAAKSIVVNRVAATTTVSSATDLTLIVIRAVYLQSNPISARLNVPGKVTFLANGKVIPGCTALKTTGSSPNFTSTCKYRPTSLGTITISATATPNDSGYIAVTKSLKAIVRPK